VQIIQGIDKLISGTHSDLDYCPMLPSPSQITCWG